MDISLARPRSHSGPGEPEAVSEEEQADLTSQAYRRWQAEQRREWGRCRKAILGATAAARAAGLGDRQVVGSPRAIERSVTQVDRRIGLG